MNDDASDQEEHVELVSNPRRPSHLDFLAFEDVEHPQPSPPYRRVPSSSQVLLPHFTDQSPAYKSRSNLDLPSDMIDVSLHDTKHPEQENDEPQKPSPKTVHYPDSTRPFAPPRPISFARVDSGLEGGTGSRTPSLAGTDDEYEDDDYYDWSGEEDLVDQEAKFEQVMGVKKKPKSWFKRFITFLFSTLIGSTLLSGILVTPAILIQFFWYKHNPTEHRRYVKDNVQAWLFWAAANISISWFLALLVDIVPTLVRYLIALAWGHVSEAVKSKIELYTSIKDNIKPLFYAASGWVSWVIIFEIIYKLYDSNNESDSKAAYTPRVYQAVEFLFFFALVICAQRILSHAIAFAFHRTAYKERLDEVTKTLNVIEKLRNYRPKHSHRHKNSAFSRGTTPILSALALSPFMEKDRKAFNSRHHTPSGSRTGSPERVQSGTESDPDATLVKSRKGKKKGGTKDTFSTCDSDHPGANVSHTYPPHNASPVRTGTNTPSRKLVDSEPEDAAAMVTHAATHAAKALKTAVLHDARNIKGTHDDNLSGLAWAVSSAHEAKRLARSIYMTLKNRHRLHLLPEDFYPAFATVEEARDAFRVFDRDNNGDLSRAEIKTTLLKVYKERRFLSRSMRDVGLALKTLDQILLIFALLCLLLISFSVFGVGIGNSLTSVYSLGIAASFIFKNSASNAFDAIMFLFVTHPFDTGDRCFIDDENLVVKKMGLFATIFQRNDGTETYYFNSMLFTKFIINARRSENTGENLVMQLDWRTPLEKIDELEKCLNGWLETEENRWYQPKTSVSLQKISYQRHLEVTICIGHNGNWQVNIPLVDWGLRLQRKTAFHAAVNYYCQHLGIISYKSPLPIAYADPDTMEYLPPMTPTLGDEDVEPPTPLPSQMTINRDGIRKTFLGFQPPSDNILGLKARKSKSRKAMLSQMGADG